jgi:non-heme chloroperoxidase
MKTTNILILAYFLTQGLQAAPATIAPATPCLRDNCIQYKMKTRDGFTVYLREWKKLNRTQHSADTQALLMMPGFPHASMLVWEKQVTSTLADKYRMVTMEIRGHGDSTKVTSPADFGVTGPQPAAYGQPQSDDIQDAITLLSLKNPVLMSHSQSGTFLSDYLHNYGDGSLGAIILTSSFTKVDLTNPGWINEVFSAAFGVIANGLVGATDDLGDFYRSQFAFGDLSFAKNPGEAYKNKIAATDMMVPPETREALFFPPRFSENSVLSTVTVPSLVIHGDKDALINVQHAINNFNLLKSGTSKASFKLMHSNGHFPQAENPGNYNRVIDEFLDHLND